MDSVIENTHDENKAGAVNNDPVVIQSDSSNNKNKGVAIDLIGNKAKKEIVFKGFENNLSKKEIQQNCKVSDATFYKYKKEWKASKTATELKVPKAIRKKTEIVIEQSVSENDKSIEPADVKVAPQHFFIEKYAAGDIVYINNSDEGLNKTSINQEAFIISVDEQTHTAIALGVTRTSENINPVFDITINPANIEERITIQSRNILVLNLSQIGKIKTLDASVLSRVRSTLLRSLDLSSNMGLDIQKVKGDFAVYSLEENMLIIKDLEKPDTIFKIDYNKVCDFIDELNKIKNLFGK